MAFSKPLLDLVIKNTMLDKSSDRAPLKMPIIKLLRCRCSGQLYETGGTRHALVQEDLYNNAKCQHA
jgi:hypothetical protein